MFSFLAVFFIRGGVWLASKVLPWLTVVAIVALVVDVVILLPLAAFHRTQAVSAVGLIISSYIFGLLWVGGLLTTYLYWGATAVFIGLFIAGIGVVPIGMLAVLIHGDWSAFGELVILIVLVFATRFGGAYIVERYETS